MCGKSLPLFALVAIGGALAMPVSSRQLPVSAPRVFPIQPGAGGKVMTVASALIAAQSNRNLYVSVQDSAANIRAKLPELQALGARLIELKQSGTAQTIDLTAAQAKLYAPVLARGKGFQVSVTDSADNILTNLDALQSLGSVLKSVQQTGTPQTLALSATQVKRNVDALAKISGFTVAVSDTGTNIANSLEALQKLGPKVSSISQSETIKVSALQARQYQNSLSTWHLSWEVVDTVENINRNLDALQWGVDLGLSNISVSGGRTSLGLTSAQMTQYADALAKISSDYRLTVSDVSIDNVAEMAANPKVVAIGIADSAANISAGLDDLQLLGSKLASIRQIGVPQNITITAEQAAMDVGALATLSGFRVAVSDTPDNIAINMAALEALGPKLVSVDWPDTSIGIVASTQDIKRYAITMAKMPSGSIAVEDTAANLSANVQLLRSLGTRLSSIARTGGTDPITVRAEDADVWFRVREGSFNVVDTTASIARNMDALRFMGDTLTSITQVDRKPLPLSIKQVGDNADVLAKITGNYSLAIFDTSKNIAQSISTLTAIDKHLVSITQTGYAEPMRLSADEARAAGKFFGKMTNPYTILNR